MEDESFVTVSHADGLYDDLFVNDREKSLYNLLFALYNYPIETIKKIKISYIAVNGNFVVLLNSDIFISNDKISSPNITLRFGHEWSTYDQIVLSQRSGIPWPYVNIIEFIERVIILLRALVDGA